MKVFLVFIFILFSGCGYKPAANFSKNIILENVFVDVKIDLVDPENLVIVKDSLNEMIVHKFNRTVTTKELADTIIYLKLKNVKFIPLRSNKDGYVIMTRAKVYYDSKVTLKDRNQEFNFLVDGSYDFAIEPNSIISDTNRFIAIDKASQKAIDKLVALISLKGGS
ncbi:MAG: hypothetical protein HXX81_00475 [Campylobacterales bacterium]|nr:hypothetical protein [Campylobacterales bacterium]